MTKSVFTLGFAALVLLALTSGTGAENLRLSVKVDDVTAKPTDTLIAVPVYASFPEDSVAGIELYFRVDENQHIQFASDDVREDGMVVALDTTGTAMSGWEYLGASSIENTTFDLKVVGLAEWPDDKITPPAPPHMNVLLATLYLRLEGAESLKDGARFDIILDSEKTSFADPRGNTIGMVTSYEKVCRQYAGDSCLNWATVRVGNIDTTAVKFHGGSITITETKKTE